MRLGPISRIARACLRNRAHQLHQIRCVKPTGEEMWCHPPARHLGPTRASAPSGSEEEKPEESRNQSRHLSSRLPATLAIRIGKAGLQWLHHRPPRKYGGISQLLEPWGVIIIVEQAEVARNGGISRPALARSFLEN